MWNEALAKFFQEQDRPVGAPPNVCRAYEEKGIAQENITNCNKFYALCNDEHILQKNITNHITNPVIVAGAYHTCILLDNNQVTCFGRGAFGQLGLEDKENRSTPGDPINLGDRTAKMIATGAAHTCILLDNNQVTCFGWGLDGQLGLGDNNNRSTPGDPINLTILK